MKKPPPTNTKHGMAHSAEYRTWESMKQRVLNSRSKYYPYYGGRGITICDKWLSFEGFYEDMGPRPEGCSIDRVDSNGNYELSNCRWATWDRQCINKRKQARNKTGKVGVDFSPGGKYVASIRVDKKKKYLGTFDSLEEASVVRREAEIKYYGEELKE